MNQAARRRLNIILTRKALLMLILVFASTACDITDGEVYHPGTGEPIRVEEPYGGMRKFAFPSGYSWD